MNAPIPKSVVAFLGEHINSLVELEALLLLYRQPERTWTASEIARELRIDHSWPKTELQGLCSKNIVQCTTGPEPAYRFAQGNPELEATVAALAAAYENRRVSIIGLIFSKPVDKLKTFGEAFRIRKEQDNG